MQTYKLKPEVFEERGQLNSQNITSFVCNPSFYNLSDVDPSQNVQIAGGKEGKTIRTYTLDFKFFQNKPPYKCLQTVTTMGGKDSGAWWGCNIVAKDMRRTKTVGNFLIVLSFTQNASAECGKLYKFTRDNEDSKWTDTPEIAYVSASTGKRDVLQNCFILEGEKILVSGNYLTLLDFNLTQLKQVHINESNDRYFITTLTKERLGWQNRPDGDDNFIIAVWPDMNKLKGYSPTPNNVPRRYVGADNGTQKSWLISCSLDVDELKWKCSDYVQKSMHFDKEYLDTLTEYAPNRFIIWSSGNHNMLIIKDWHVIHALKDEQSGNNCKTWV